MPNRSLIALVLILAACLLPEACARAAKDSAGPSAGAAAAFPGQARRFSFPALDKQPAIRMRTNESMPGFFFGLRSDETATRGLLKFRYTYSPALTPLQSHVRVMLNGEIVGLLPVTREQAGRSVTQEIDVDPRLIARVNKLSLEFIGHYTAESKIPCI